MFTTCAILSTSQVIYKKFTVRCPFVDFALNATAVDQNLNSTYMSGEANAACIPKMANLNTRVGVHISLIIKPAHPPSPPAMAADRHPLYATIIFSMTPVTVHKPSMEITHSLRPSVLSGGHGDIYQAANGRQGSCDAPWPWGCTLVAFCCLQWDHLDDS